MIQQTRRDFLADVGRGMLIASLGSVVARDLGLSTAWADDGQKSLTFGALEPLVCAMQETPVEKLMPMLVGKISNGTDLKTLVAAGALANARTFGGQDYDGYHAFMALIPALEMSRELPDAKKPLPVLKVLYRNSARIQNQGGRHHEILHPIHGSQLPKEQRCENAVRDAVRKANMDAAEHTFADVMTTCPDQAYDDLLVAIQDEIDVHRVVLAWRSWAMLDVAGREQAHTLLRQSVRFCVKSEKERIARKQPASDLRTLLPKLIDQYRLAGRPAGTRVADDAWVAEMCETIYGQSRERAADAVAAALAEGISPESIGEAISLASNQLVMRDPGRSRDDVGKPKGSIHGASVGVHASDSANAWRNIARVSNARNTMASLIVGAYHTAGQTNGLNAKSYPLAEHLEKVTVKDAAGLLAETKSAVEAKDQARACALVQRYGELGFAPRAVFDLLLQYACSEDGALHAEKYYRTVVEEFAVSRPAFRWRHLTALARVTASEYGFPAPGFAEAKRLINA